MAHPDAGQRGEQQQDSRQAQDGGCDHQCSGGLDVGWQQQDVRQRLAVVQSDGDHAVRPQPPGAHLVQLPAGGDAVAAGQDPVVGSGGDHDPDPADEARDEGAKL